MNSFVVSKNIIKTSKTLPVNDLKIRTTVQRCLRILLLDGTISIDGTNGAYDYNEHIGSIKYKNYLYEYLSRLRKSKKDFLSDMLWVH